jgi:hypothetical protein
VGAGGILLVALAYTLARVAAAPAKSAPEWLRRAGTALTAVGTCGALALFLAAARGGSAVYIGCATALVLGISFVRAWTDDF